MPLSLLNNFSSSLLLIGAGRMGGSMLQCWLNLGLPPEQITVCEPQPSDALKALLAHYPALKHTSEPEAGADIVLLAIKPQQFKSFEAHLAHAVHSSTLVLSMLAGKTLSGLCATLSSEQPVIRAMPNTPASIGRGMTVLVGNAHVACQHKDAANQLMQAVGEVAWITDEKHMDAVTALSGSGPAYVFLLTEALSRAGVALGLEPELAMQLARQTVSGSGELQYRSAEDVATLRHNVTSPHGTTAAALEVLMGADGLEALMKKATTAAANRSRELAE